MFSIFPYSAARARDYKYALKHNRIRHEDTRNGAWKKIAGALIARMEYSTAKKYWIGDTWAQNMHLGLTFLMIFFNTNRIKGIDSLFLYQMEVMLNLLYTFLLRVHLLPDNLLNMPRLRCLSELVERSKILMQNHTLKCNKSITWLVSNSRQCFFSNRFPLFCTRIIYAQPNT